MPRQMPTTLRPRISRSSPRRKPPPSRSKPAAAVPEIDTPSRTVRPPFRLFDPFSAGLLRFQPNGSSTAPVLTPVATEFNPGERHYHTINRPLPSIQNSPLRDCRVKMDSGGGGWERLRHLAMAAAEIPHVRLANRCRDGGVLADDTGDDSFYIAWRNRFRLE